MSTVTTPVRDEPPPAPEELVLGPRSRRQLPRWVPVVALLLGVLIVAGAAAWRFWPRPLAPLSLAELQDTYAGMVRSDGTNDASVVNRRTIGTGTPVTVTPTDCLPLVQTTQGNQFPAAALDGVSTYWLGQGTTISLFTLRFPDAAAAEEQRAQIATALDSCVGRQLVISSGRQSAPDRVTLARTPAGTGRDDQLGYTLTSPDGISAIQLMPYLNTLTWQYRYETGSASYSPLAADQLMSGLHSQLDAVVAARPR